MSTVVLGTGWTGAWDFTGVGVGEGVGVDGDIGDWDMGVITGVAG